jgi:hypothetical protein
MFNRLEGYSVQETRREARQEIARFKNTVPETSR